MCICLYYLFFIFVHKTFLTQLFSNIAAAYFKMKKFDECETHCEKYLYFNLVQCYIKQEKENSTISNLYQVTKKLTENILSIEALEKLYKDFTSTSKRILTKNQ